MRQFADTRQFAALALTIVVAASAFANASADRRSLGGGWLARATSAQTPAQRPTFRTSTDAMWVTATAIDREGRLVIDLGRDEFELLVDGVVQPITVFRSDPVPFALSVMFDLSGSLEGSLGTIKRIRPRFPNDRRPGPGHRQRLQATDDRHREVTRGSSQRSRPR